MQGRPACQSLPLGDRRGARDRVQRGRLPRVRVAARAKPEYLHGFVILEDRASVRPRKLIGAGDDRVQHRVEVERRAHRAAHLAQGGELLHRALELTRARAELLEQPHVLHCDHRLIRECLDQLDLPLGESPLPPARYRNHADHLARPQHGRGEGRAPPVARRDLAGSRGHDGVGLDVLDMDHRGGQDAAAHGQLGGGEPLDRLARSRLRTSGPHRSVVEEPVLVACTQASQASKRRRRLSAMVSNTGCTSVWERLMTRRISPVAVCCSSDSVKSRFRSPAP